MLVVTVEIFPGGDESGRREIARMVAGNISNLNALSDYAILTTEKGSVVTGLRDQKHSFKIEAHPREQSVFALIAKAAAHAASLSRQPIGAKAGEEMSMAEASDEIGRLRASLRNLYGWVSNYPVKHPQQTQWRREAAKLLGIDERPCETCNDDPVECANVHGLWHCEKANRAR